MELLDKYQTAKKDISLNKHPHRQSGKMQWTPGHRKILSRQEYRSFRILDNEIERLKGDKVGQLQEMILYQTPFDERQKNHIAKFDGLKSRLRNMEEKSSLKETEKSSIIDDMKNRGIQLYDEEPEIKAPKKAESRFKIRDGSRIFTIVLIYLVIEVFIYFTQYDSQRDVKSYEEIGARVLAMFILVGAFHIVAHLNRLKKKPVYSIYLGFSILLITIMMFAPPALHFAYPETVGSTGSESLWSIEENEPAEQAGLVSDVPNWVGLYRKMEWAPAGLGIIVFLIIFFALPNPLWQKDTSTDLESSLEEDGKNDDQASTKLWAQKELRILSKTTAELKAASNNIAERIHKLQNSTDDMLPIRSKLRAMKKAVQSLDRQIVKLSIEKEELLHDLETELNDYQVEFENILTNDQVKNSVMNPEWPTRTDIVQHYKLSS